MALQNFKLNAVWHDGKKCKYLWISKCKYLKLAILFPCTFSSPFWRIKFGINVLPVFVSAKKETVNLNAAEARLTATVALLQTTARLLQLSSCKIAISRNVPTHLLFHVLLINLLWCLLESYLASLRKITVFFGSVFFLLALPLKMCTIRCCSEAACCPPWGDSRL